MQLNDLKYLIQSRKNYKDIKNGFFIKNNIKFLGFFSIVSIPFLFSINFIVFLFLSFISTVIFNYFNNRNLLKIIKDIKNNINYKDEDAFFNYLTKDLSLNDIVDYFFDLYKYFKESDLEEKFWKLIPEDYYKDEYFINKIDFVYFIHLKKGFFKLNPIKYFLSIEPYLINKMDHVKYLLLKKQIINTYLEENIKNNSLNKEELSNLLNYLKNNKIKNNNISIMEMILGIDKDLNLNLNIINAVKNF